jgi:hypothetical protein
MKYIELYGDNQSTHVDTFFCPVVFVCGVKYMVLWLYLQSTNY